MSKNKKKKKAPQKGWAGLSKNKKIAIIVGAVIAGLLVLALIGGSIALSIYCKTPDYEIYETEMADVYLIGHRGMRSLAPENTLPAFEEAGKHDYWGAECDVYRTEDGVWVISHDPNTFRMQEGMSNISRKTYSELLELKVNSGSNIDEYPDLTMCSLEDYMISCLTNHMVPVIELKGKKDIPYYEELADQVSQYNLPVVYISFNMESLQAMRQFYNGQLYYLTNKIKQDDIDAVKELGNCGIDFNGNKKKNLESGMIEKCLEENIPIVAYTIDDLETMNALYEKGVRFFTTDNIVMEGKANAEQ